MAKKDESPKKDSKKDKVFDVSKPGKGSVDIGSKPMIVGHKSMASDPMMRDEKTEADLANEIEQSVAQTSKIKIEPVSEDLKSPQDKTESESDEVQSSDDTSGDMIEVAAEDVDESVNEVDDPVKKNSEKESKKETDKDQAAHEEINEQSDDTTSNESSEKDKEEKKTAGDGADEEGNNTNDDPDTSSDGKTEKKEELDPAAVAMERDEKLQKIIESKKYRLNIKETSSTHMSKKNKLIAVIATVLVALCGLFFAVDTGALDIGFELPFSIFGKEETQSLTESTPEVVVSDIESEPETAMRASEDADQNEKSAFVEVTTDESIGGGLKKYVNTEFTVEFLYNELWKRFVIASDSPTVSPLLLTLFESENYKTGVNGIEEGALVSFNISNTASTTPQERAIALQGAENSLGYDSQTVEVITVNGQEVVRYQNEDQAKSVSFEWVRDSQIYELNYAAAEQPDSPEYESTDTYQSFQQILGTVRFSEFETT